MEGMLLFVSISIFGLTVGTILIMLILKILSLLLLLLYLYLMNWYLKCFLINLIHIVMSIKHNKIINTITKTSLNYNL